jgi:peptide/nickel transport system substrate-binding protein
VATRRPLALNPLVDRADPAARDVGALLYRRLLTLDGHALPTADLAESWGISGDGLSYRFTLRPGLRWSDGGALTVHDAEATIGLVQSAGFPDTTLAATWHGVRVSTEGDSILTLTLPQARASFAAAVADLPIVPAAALAHTTVATLERTASRPMPTSGPFRVEVADASRVRLVPNREGDQQPQLHAVEFRLVASFEAATQALALGQVDGVVATTPAQRAVLARLPGVRLHDLTTFRFVDLLLNQRKPGLDDPAVRRAVATVVDRHQLIAAALDGDARPQVSAFPAGITWIAAPQQELPSAALSGRALDAAGWIPGPDGVRHKGETRLAFSLSVPDAAPMPAVGVELARQLRSVGIAVTPAVVKPAAFEQTVLVPESFDMVVADWDNGPDPDVSSFWRSNATPPHGFNVSGGPPDPFLDRALDSLATVTDSRLRRVAAAQVDARLAEDTPAVFLYAPEVTVALSEQIVGVSVPPVGTGAARFDSVTTWRREGG